MITYDYFELDGALYRRRLDYGNFGPVEDIWAESQWQPYTGDRVAPTMFGMHLSPDEAQAFIDGG
jgi:hypothetical protein